jgi:hypothetical protein
MKQGDYIAIAALIALGVIGWKAATMPRPTPPKQQNFSSACGCGA